MPHLSRRQGGLTTKHCRMLKEVMQTIYLITTGATIEKVYSAESGALLNSANKVTQYLKTLRLPVCDVQLFPLMSKGSREIVQNDREHLVSLLDSLLPNENPILITHDTDSMVETGLYLKGAFPDVEVPIILTGAMTPLGFEGSDGLQNLTESLFAAKLLGPGVYIVIHSQVFPVDRARKDQHLGTFVEECDHE